MRGDVAEAWEGDEEDLYEHFRFVAEPGQKLLRVDKFLFNFMTHTSRNRIQKAAEAGAIRVNAQPVKSNYRVKPGDVVTLVLAQPPSRLNFLRKIWTWMSSTKTAMWSSSIRPPAWWFTRAMGTIRTP